ncbi:hypothetical protein V8E36_007595 [Tilletia maclaganii]
MSTAAAASRPSATSALPPPTALIVALLVPASMLGTLTRIGITQLLTYNGATLDPPIIWAQIIGCAVFGGALQNKAHFDAIILRGRRPGDAGLQLGAALYTALTSGYSGSVTTFSTWILDVYLAWANYESIPRTGGKSFATGLSQTLVTLLLAFASFRLGMKCAEEGEPFSMKWLVKLLPDTFKSDGSPGRPDGQPLDELPSGPSIRAEEDQPSGSNAYSIPEPRSRHVSSTVLAASLLAFGLIVMLSLLAALHTPSRLLSLALVFSPPGAVLRWYLSRLNGRSLGASHNRKYGSTGFPIGTFLANLIGVIIACGSWTALHTSRSRRDSTEPYSRLTCDVVDAGLEMGLSGALSTISTFVAELYTLGAGLQTRRAAVNYGILSWSCGILLTVFLVAIPTGALNYVNRCPY